MAKNDDRLAALRKKLENENLDSSRGTKYFNPEEGSNQVRIMPPVGEMEVFYTKVGIHYMPDKSRVYCPRVISDGADPCPICELVDTLYKSGQDKFAGKLRVSRKWWMNVIDRNDESSGPKVYTAPKSVFAAIVSLINDPDWGYIMDEYTGVDIVVEKTKTGPEARNVDYQTQPRRRSVPLAYKQEDGEYVPDEAKIDKWFEQAKELTVGQFTDDPDEDSDMLDKYGILYHTYDRIVEDTLGDLDKSTDAGEDEPEESGDEDVSEVKEAIKERKTKRRARRKRKRRAVT